MGLAMGSNPRKAWLVIAGLLAAFLLIGTFIYIDHAPSASRSSELDVGAVPKRNRSMPLGLPVIDAGLSKSADTGSILIDTRKAIIERAKDTNAVVALQRGLVQGLLDRGKYGDALREAKGYYNVAPLKATGDAIDLVSAALCKTNPTLAVEFKKQQADGACVPTMAPSTPSVLRGIELDGSPYATEIEKNPSADNYDALMARGNLLLLEDRADEAREAFLAACKARGKKTNDKGFFASVEGVARATRAHDSIAGPANAMVLGLMLGRTHGSSFPDGAWENGELQLAGQRVALAQLSKSSSNTSSGDADDESSSPIEKSAQPSTSSPCDLGDPVIVAMLAPDADAEVIAWLQKWRQSSVAEKKTSEQDRLQLGAILQRTKLPCMILFQIGHAFQFLTEDYDATALFYETGASRAEAELEVGASQQRIAIVRSIKDHVGGFRRVLWTIGHSERPAVEALFTLYTCYVRWAPVEDSEFQKQRIAFTVSAAECLNFHGRSDEAIVMLNSLTDKQIADARLRSSVDFQYGEALYRSGRCTDAVPRLKSAAKSPRYARFALPHLCDALVQVGQTPEAVTVFDEWVRTCNPSKAESDRLAAKIRQ
jgi:hypothetical protein